MSLPSRKELMIESERRTMIPTGSDETFEVIDFMEMEPGIAVLTYRYSSTFGSRRSTTARWASTVNGHALSGGVLWTDFEDVTE